MPLKTLFLALTVIAVASQLLLRRATLALGGAPAGWSGLPRFVAQAALSPWIYAPADRRRRLAWFAGATLLAGALAVRAYMTGT